VSTELPVQYLDHPNGSLKSIVYSKKVGSGPHHPDGPAEISWHTNGQIKTLAYCVDGVLTDIDGPAYREWYADGSVREIEYYRDGSWHRLPSQGPALILYDESRKVVNEFYRWNGREVERDYIPDEMKERDGLGRVFV